MRGRRKNIGDRRIAGILLISILAGISYLFLLRSHMGSRRHIHRVLPPIPFSVPVAARLRPNATFPQRLQEFGEAARQRLRPAFDRAGVAYPPRRVILVGLKQERLLEVYAPDSTGRTRFICEFPILAASGQPGPKLRQGDRQVPEGFYKIVLLNANSHFHVSLRLDYPNAFDRAQAAREGRTRPGKDIMIHGSNVSAGCLAMGDMASEDLFTLAADTGPGNIQVILSPVDFRTQGVLPDPMRPPWVMALYSELRQALLSLPVPS